MFCPRFAFRLPSNHEGAGKTGCVPHPRSRARCCACNDGDMVSRSRDMICPRFASLGPPSNMRAQGRPGACRTRGPVCGLRMRMLHTSIQVRRKHPGLPCAMALRLISCSSRRERLSCLRRPGEAFAAPELDASDCGVRTTRLHRTRRPRSSVVALASIASRRAFVTMADAPHPAVMTGGVMALISEKRK